MGIEYELKFQADAEAISAIDAAFENCPRKQFQMHTTYYDTPSCALSARHYTLRQRLENDQYVCTLKTPAEGISRNELELVCDDFSCAVEYFCKNGAPEDFAELISEGLSPVCGAKFQRTAFSFGVDETTSVELALDRGILIGGEQSIPLCEVEVELKSGSKELTDAFATILADRYGLIPERKSKFRRAFALYQQGGSV